MRELAPIALVGIVPCVVVVAEATPVRTPQELVAYAKANAGKLSFSSSGVGNPQQLAGELMNMMAGTQRAARAVPGSGARGDRRCDRHRDHELHEPCRRAGPAAGGQGPRGRGHLARAHAATARCRAAAEGAPGLKGYELLNWFGLFTTAGTPAAVVKRYNQIAGESAGGAEDRRNAEHPGHRAAQDDARSSSRPSSSPRAPSSRGSSRRPTSNWKISPALRAGAAPTIRYHGGSRNSRVPAPQWRIAMDAVTPKGKDHRGPALACGASRKNGMAEDTFPGLRGRRRCCLIPTPD